MRVPEIKVDERQPRRRQPREIFFSFFLQLKIFNIQIYLFSCRFTFYVVVQFFREVFTETKTKRQSQSRGKRREPKSEASDLL